MTELNHIPQQEDHRPRPAHGKPIEVDHGRSPPGPAHTGVDEPFVLVPGNVVEYEPNSNGVGQETPSIPTAQTLPNHPIEEAPAPHPPQPETPDPSLAATASDQPIVGAAPRNIIFFGETGVGKSTIINMLRQGPGSTSQSDSGDVAIVSSDALGCTLDSKGYPCTLEGSAYTLWDTAGLVEGEFGNVTAAQAEENLVNLLRTIEGGGVSLLVYCIRARRFRPIVKDHYELFFEKTCGREIPILLVATGLEHEPNMEDWWVRNKGAFDIQEIRFNDCACITSTRGKATPDGHMFDMEYEQSEERLRERITKLCLPVNKAVLPSGTNSGLSQSTRGKRESSVLVQSVSPPQQHSLGAMKQWWRVFRHGVGQLTTSQESTEDYEPVRDDMNNVLYSEMRPPRTYHPSAYGYPPGSWNYEPADDATSHRSFCW